jgi:hypothetical protein
MAMLFLGGILAVAAEFWWVYRKRHVVNPNQIEGDNHSEGTSAAAGQDGSPSLVDVVEEAGPSSMMTSSSPINIPRATLEVRKSFLSCGPFRKGRHGGNKQDV